MTPIEAIKACYLRTFDYTGRSRRSEFWWFWLYGFIILMLFAILMESKNETLGAIFGCVAFLNLFSGLAVRVRRLHDTGKSGWWMAVWIIGIIRLYLFFCFMGDSDVGDNEYGPSPKEQ